MCLATSAGPIAFTPVAIEHGGGIERAIGFLGRRTAGLQDARGDDDQAWRPGQRRSCSRQACFVSDIGRQPVQPSRGGSGEAAGQRGNRYEARVGQERVNQRGTDPAGGSDDHGDAAGGKPSLDHTEVSAGPAPGLPAREGATRFPCTRRLWLLIPHCNIAGGRHAVDPRRPRHAGGFLSRVGRCGGSSPITSRATRWRSSACATLALCDSAEVFVLLAGYGAGLAYGRSMDRHGWLYSAADVLKRAWTLYIAHIFLFVVFAAQVSFSATALDRTDYLDEIHLDVLGEEPYRAMLEALALHFQPAYLDILPMYIVLLASFAVMLPLLRRPRVLAILSLALYAAARVYGLNLSSWKGGTWYFNPLTWQLLFVLGAIMAYAPVKRPRARVTAAIDALCVVVLAFGVLMQWVVWEHPTLLAHAPARLARVLLSVDKEGLHPFRLSSILALAWAVSRLVPASAQWITSRWAAPFVLCGQHSLPVFCVGIFLSFLGRLTMEEASGWWVQAGVNGLGALILVAVGALAAWYREKGRSTAAPLAGRVAP